jgi:hypothetical protein
MGVALKQTIYTEHLEQKVQDLKDSMTESTKKVNELQNLCD